MTLHRVYLLRCDSCGAVLPEPVRGTAIRNADRFRRWSRRAGWRRHHRRDLCPTCTADQRVRDRIAALPRGLF